VSQREVNERAAQRAVNEAAAAERAAAAAKVADKAAAPAWGAPGPASNGATGERSEPRKDVFLVGGNGVGPAERPPGDEPYTTVMLRNIPNKYTREMLIKQLQVDFTGEFDFMYLPIDFKNKCNVGYGFINFQKQDSCERFVGQFHGVDVRKCLPGLNSKKVVEVTPARVQGLGEN
ncbi:unnamed protein product, partial [Polarella glacialis]